MAELTITVTDELLGELARQAEKADAPIESVATKLIQTGLFPTSGLGATRCLSFRQAVPSGIVSSLDPQLFDAPVVLFAQSTRDP